MKNLILILSLFVSMVALADTPPPGTVKAKMFTGDGLTGLTATGTSLDVNVTSGGSSTVNQGDAGSESWLVAVTSSSLPTNACKETGGHLASIDAELGAPLAVTGTFWPVTQPVSGTFWQVTQPVSIAATVPVSIASTVPVVVASPLPAGSNTIGAVTISGTVPVSAASLPLPTGASTAAKQPALGTAGTASSDVITVQGVAGMTAIKSDGSSFTQPVSGTFWQATQPVSGTFWQATQPVSGTFWQATQPVSLASAPLPTGAATETTLSAINTKTPALGQALAAASVPVVLTAAQITTLTPLSTVTANIGTSGSLALDASVTALQVSQGSTTSGQKGSLSLGAVTTAAPTYTTAQSSPLSLTTAGGLRVDGSGVTQPVSAASLPLPSGASTAANQSTGNASLATIATNTTNAGTPVVSGTVIATQGTGSNLHVVSDAGSAIIGKVGIDQTTPGTTNLVALAANQSVNVAQINGVTPLMGAGNTGTGSARVTIATDQAAVQTKAPVNVTGSGSAAAATVSTVATLTAPSNAVGFILQNLDTSTTNMRWSVGRTASTTLGQQLQPGRDSGFVPIGANVSIIAESGTCNYDIQWIAQ